MVMWHYFACSTRRRLLSQSHIDLVNERLHALVAILGPLLKMGHVLLYPLTVLASNGQEEALLCACRNVFHDEDVVQAYSIVQPALLLTALMSRAHLFIPNAHNLLHQRVQLCSVVRSAGPQMRVHVVCPDGLAAHIDRGRRAVLVARLVCVEGDVDKGRGRGEQRAVQGGDGCGDGTALVLAKAAGVMDLVVWHLDAGRQDGCRKCVPEEGCVESAGERATVRPSSAIRVVC